MLINFYVVASNIEIMLLVKYKINLSQFIKKHINFY